LCAGKFVAALCERRWVSAVNRPAATSRVEQSVRLLFSKWGARQRVPTFIGGADLPVSPNFSADNFID